MAITLSVNKKPVTIDAPDDKPLLWALREDLNLVGTKFGCGIAACGACTVLVDGAVVRSCVMPISAVVGKQIVTIEAISENGLNPVQKAWIEHQVPRFHHGDHRVARKNCRTDGCRHQCGDHQFVSLWHVSGDARGDKKSGANQESDAVILSKHSAKRFIFCHTGEGRYPRPPP